MAVKLHRCNLMFIKGGHPCWRVQKALDEASVDYEIVTEPLRRGRRTEVIQKTGQKLVPVIELRMARSSGKTHRSSSPAFARTGCMLSAATRVASA